MDGLSGRPRQRLPLGIVCLVLLVIGNVQSEGTCKSGCNKGVGGHSFKYSTGTTYKYNYDGKIEISLSSAEGQQTATEVKATVLLTQLADCNQLLRLQDVQVLTSGSKHGSIPDIDKQIRINYNGGELDDGICVENGDTQNSINIKRAIASLFQASAKSGYETDVFGRCPTETSVHKEGDTLIVEKSRALNKCSYREHIQQGFLSTTINLNSEIKSSPLLSGQYGANLRIKGGILQEATVTEDYLFVPFSVGKNGAKATVVSKLKFVEQKGGDHVRDQTQQPRSIIFENPHPVVASTSNVHAILTALKEVTATVDVGVTENTAREFIHLIKIVKVSNKNDLLAVYNQARSGLVIGNRDAALRFYLDALLRSGNGESVEALLELLDKKQLSESDSKLALLGLNVVRHATPGSVEAATRLLAQPDLPREAYLGIGNLAGHYCKQHNCEALPEITNLNAKLLSKIGTAYTNKEQENDAVYALKALANVRFLTDKVVDKVTSVAQNKNLPVRVRVAALEAYLADGCRDKIRNSALQILNDVQQDSEVRIKAYLVLAECPNAKIGNAVKSLLAKEPSTQVGGFIASHIHAIRASANPDKALAKQFLGFSVHRSFPIDPRKYSFNGEFSYAIDTLGLGSSAETNVIYSQNSWLPRSTNLNLTAQLFGHSFNFLEIETRQENLDRLIEHYLGPKGVLKRSLLPSLIKEGKGSYDKLTNYVEEQLKATLKRSKRDVSRAEVEGIAKQVQIKTNDLNKDLDLDLGVKLFGSEVFFLNVNQEAKIKPTAIVDKVLAKLGSALDKLNNFEETLRSNIQFLDAEIDYPTSLGFPLRLAVEGSANLQVTAAGHVDVRQLINNPAKGELKVKLIPSANIEVAGRLTLDALVVENGLKVISTLLSSTGGDASLSWDKETGFDLKFGLPVQEQKLISANHEIVFVTKEQTGRDVNIPLKFTQVKEFSVCLDHLSPFIGLTFCADINGPNVGGQHIPILPFPFAGDANVAVRIENDDVSQFHVKTTFEKTRADFVVETIGKNNKQKVAFNVEAEYSPERFIKATFNSPAKSATAEARIVVTNTEKSLLAKFVHDKNEFVARIGIDVSGTPERSVYKPILELKTPKGEQPLPIKTEGQVIVERNGPNVKYIFDNVKVSDAQRHVSLTGNVGRESEVFFSDIKLSDQSHSVGLQGRLQLSSELIKYNIKVDNTFNNNANFILKGELKRKHPHYDVSFQLTHGPDLNSKESVLTFYLNLVNKFESASNFDLKIKTSLSYPLLGVSGKFELEQTPKSLDYEIEAEYGELKLGSDLEAKFNDKSFGDYQVEFEVWGLDNKLELKFSRQVLPDEESKIAHTVELNGKKFEIEGKIRHDVKPHSLDLGTELVVKIPSQVAPYELNTILKLSLEDIDAAVKLTSGSQSIIDSFIKGDRKGYAYGVIKVNLKDLLTVNGEVRSNNGAGKANILIDIQNGKRQVNAETTFTVRTPEVFDVTFTLYPSYGKDKTSKIFYRTQNKVTQNSLDSKNQVDILGHAIEVNFKGSRTGDIHNGKIDGEFELGLPAEQYLLLKFDRDHQKHDGRISAQEQASFEFRKNKNTPGSKVTYKGAWKNTNFQEGIVDAVINFSTDDSTGNTFNGDLTVQTSKQDDIFNLNLANKLYGSVLKNPLQLKIVSKCNKGQVTSYDVESSYGEANKVSINGNHDFSKAKKTGQLNIEAISASEHLNSLKVSLSGNFNKPESASVPLQFEGNFNANALNNKGTLLDLKLQGNVNVGTKAGHIKGNLNFNDVAPISVETKYNLKEHGGSTSATIQYGEKKIKYDINLERKGDHEYKLSVNLQSPFDGFKNTHLTVSTVRSTDGRDVTSAVELNVDNKVWKLNSQLALNELNPVVDIKLVNPDKKVQQFYVKANKGSFQQFSGELKLINEEKDFIFDSALSVNVENIENLIIKGQVHSPALKLNKIVFEASNKGTGNDRKIHLAVKTAGKNYISGNLGYEAKDQNGKFIVDGSGTFAIKDATKTGNFKYIVERLQAGEQGILVSFDGTIGDKAIDSEYKLTNKQFRTQVSYCEQKKECAYVEIDNKINVNDVENFNQVLEINLDLRKLGLSHEFGLKAVTTRKNWIIDHTVDAHFQNQENSKYQYSFYVHPTEAGLSLTTPQRIVSLEAKNSLPKNFSEGGKVSGGLAFYLDKKNHANKKTALTWNVDIDPRGHIRGDTKFSHPGLKKTLGGSFTANRQGNPFNGKLILEAELDVFKQDDQKIVFNYQGEVSSDDAKTKGSSRTTYSIRSAGLQLSVYGSEVFSGDTNLKEFTYSNDLVAEIGRSKYENSVSSKLAPNEVSGLIKVLNKILLKSVFTYKISDNEQRLQHEFSSYDNNPIVSVVEVKNYNTLAYSVGLVDHPRNKLLFHAGLIPGQVADVRADRAEGDTKINLFYANLKLDDANFLKPDYKVDSTAIKTVAEKVKDYTRQFVLGFESIGKEWVEEATEKAKYVGQLVKQAAPNLKPLTQYYTEELKNVQQEILNDKNVKELGEAVRKVFGSLIAATSELIEKLSKLVEESAVVIENAFKGVIESIEKELIPQLKQIASALIANVKSALDLVLDIVVGVVAKVVVVLEKYQPELKDIALAFGELFRDVGKLIYRVYENGHEQIKAFSSKISNEIKASPYFEELKAQYEHLLKEGLPNADLIINSLREIFNTIKDLIPAEFVVRDDIARLLDLVADYTDKKLHNQAVNDGSSLEDIGRAIAVIFKKLFSIIKTEGFQLPGASQLGTNIVPVNYLGNLPHLVAAKFSPISYILDQDRSAEIGRFLLSFVNNPRNLVPPFPLFAVIVQGQHLFTFDGKYLNFPGKCNYLLASDALNGNFTLAGSYKDGHLASITLVDASGDTVTLIQGGKIKGNGEATELPYRKKSIAAWRDYEIVTLHSTAGITVDCTPDLVGCAVKVSGFYHGQLRGLLGNGNGELYDDFTIPAGKIVTGAKDFANSYKLQSGCADVGTPKIEDIKENPVCSKLFSWESPLRLCYPFVPTEQFKTACSQGLAAKIKGTEEAFAKAYVAVCQQRNIPVHVPESLVKCTNGNKPYHVGDTFSVKLPSKAADIVIIVDTIKSNQPLYVKLIKNLIPDISTELHNKGITDVQFHLITYRGLNQWPTHVTVGGKLTFKGKAPALQFAEEPEDPYALKEIQNAEVLKLAEHVKVLLKDVGLATGFNLKTQTLAEAYNYPFRAHALKTMVILNGDVCEVGKFYPLQKLLALAFKTRELTMNLFTPLSSLSLKDAKKNGDVVGFNEKHVFTLTQAKKNPKGSAELLKELDYDDYCSEFVAHNRGNVFINDNFLGLGENDQKQFSKVAAVNIVEPLINVEQGLDCQCKLINPWHGSNVCREVFIKDREPKKV